MTHCCCCCCCRWLEVGGRSTEDVLDELLAELANPQHEGGCGDSGRLDKATQKALKQYNPSLKLYNDDGRCEGTLQWVREAVQQPREAEDEQQQQQQQLAGATSRGPAVQ
jgi:tRNA dimethylallyltransferase